MVSGGRSLLKATDRGKSTELFLILLRVVLPGIVLNVKLEGKPYNLNPYALLYIYSNIILCHPWPASTFHSIAFFSIALATFTLYFL